jgi:hypothetical protein
LFICAGSEGVVIAEIDRSGVPRRSGSCATAGDARDIAFDGNSAFVADGKAGVSILDVATPRAPRLLTTVSVQDFAHGIAASGGIIYVADGSAGVAINRFDRSSASLEPLSRSDAAGGYSNKVTVAAGRLLVANDFKGLQIRGLAELHEKKPGDRVGH